jgi:hypothetical protein
MAHDCFHQPADNTARQAAERYAARGWAVIPIPHRSKNPGFKRWEQMRLAAEEIEQHFNGRPQNIGVLLGEPSDWLIDVDLDHMRAVELAPKFLPETPAIFGRSGKPRSHWLYRVTKPLTTKKWSSKSSGMIVEVRSTGLQTIFPPSIHETGEAIEWIDESQQPAAIDPAELIEAAQKLADTVKIELGEKQTPRRKVPLKPPTAELPNVPVKIDMQEQAKRCLAAMRRIKIVDQRDGSRRLFVAACRCVEHDLDDDTAIKAIQEYARRYPFRVSWSSDEILKRVRDAEKQCRRGQALHKSADGCIALGSREPHTGRLVLSPSRTLPTAQAFVLDFYLAS